MKESTDQVSFLHVSPQFPGNVWPEAVQFPLTVMGSYYIAIFRGTTCFFNHMLILAILEDLWTKRGNCDDNDIDTT